MADTRIIGTYLEFTDKKGLFDMLSKTYPVTENDQGLFTALERFITTDMDGYLFGNADIWYNSDPCFDLSCNGYDGDKWELLAPYIEGYVEWFSEGGNLWRDYFKDGKMRSVDPIITWPDEDHPE